MYRFDRELNHVSNSGLSKAIGFLEPLHYKYYEISWADLIQMVFNSYFIIVFCIIINIIYNNN